MSVVLLSTYDLGRQPFGLASAAAALEAGGVDVACVDLSRDPLPEAAVRAASLVAFFVPMHTATRLALPVIDRVRELNPRARLCAYGLYAPLTADALRERGVHEIIGGEFEDDLTRVARRTSHVTGSSSPVARSTSHVPRVHFHVPRRESLPALERYAKLQYGPELRTVGYTEASRGCKHRCRHCPIVPVYDGRFRIVPEEVVIEDVRRQVAAGARHITFGDPDFFNGPRHAVAIARRLAAEWPGLSYDVTVKVEHLLARADLIPVLVETGCAFVTTAVESIDDEVLGKLQKGHTAADFEATVALSRRAGLVLSPTFVAFTPWTTLEGYCALMRAIDRLRLVDHVAPIQFAIRLLITTGSRLLELDDIREVAGPLDRATLTHAWSHPDPAVDALHATVAAIVGRRLNAPRRSVFDEIWRAAHEAAGIVAPPRQDTDPLPRAAIPYLNEPWYC